MDVVTGISIGPDCSGTRPTCSHAVSIQVKDERARHGSRWIDRGLLNGIEIFNVINNLPPGIDVPDRDHFERYRTCRHDATSVKQRYKKHKPNVSETVTAAAKAAAAEAPVAIGGKDERKQKKATKTNNKNKKKGPKQETDAVPEQPRSDEVGVIMDHEAVPNEYMHYSATQLNVKRKRRRPRDTDPPYTHEPVDPFAGVDEQLVTRLFKEKWVPCDPSHAVSHGPFTWDPSLTTYKVPKWPAQAYPLCIQNLVSKCVITGKLNPDDFRNVLEGCIKRFPAHTVKLTTCSQTLFEEGQMNIAGRTDRLDELLSVHAVLFYLSRLTGKRYGVNNFGVVNIATSADLEHKINLHEYHRYLRAMGLVAIYEPENFPGCQWGLVPAGSRAAALAKLLEREASGKKRGKRKRVSSSSLAASASSSTQKGPVVQAFLTGSITVVGLQSERNVKVAEAGLVPYIAKLVRTFPPPPPSSTESKKMAAQKKRQAAAAAKTVNLTNLEKSVK